MLCGRCHREGTEVSLQHDIPQDRILENFSMSVHGDALFNKGLTVTAVCTSCHTAHNILPHSDPKSSIHADNVAATCSACHAEIERVHRKVIEGELWRAEPDKIPACVDCHAPHKIRNVFYPDGLADKDCLTCHSDPDLSMTKGGETISLFVDEASHEGSIHADTSCAQCHTGVTVAQERGYDIREGTAEDLPFEDESFDLSISYNLNGLPVQQLIPVTVIDQNRERPLSYPLILDFF